MLSGDAQCWIFKISTVGSLRRCKIADSRLCKAGPRRLRFDGRRIGDGLLQASVARAGWQSVLASSGDSGTDNAMLRSVSRKI